MLGAGCQNKQPSLGREAAPGSSRAPLCKRSIKNMFCGDFEKLTCFSAAQSSAQVLTWCPLHYSEQLVSCAWIWHPLCMEKGEEKNI